MKVISTGSKFDIYPDDLKSFDRLPANYYVVRFHPKKGFYLEKYTEFQMTESKIYGIHLEKVHKVLKLFDAFNRNLGVILSGDKGIGKSLFARLLGREAVNNGMPVIIVEGFIEGIGSFIDSIDQEVLVLFDEFDKTFACSRDDFRIGNKAYGDLLYSCHYYKELDWRRHIWRYICCHQSGCSFCNFNS